jgi:DHA1 family bicyclomycin/chloramphenicol resistance-like MFS transporter
VLALLSATAPLAINMYLPALPEIAVGFGVDVPGIQLSVGLFLLGLGMGQFSGAPLSDRYGRRPTAIAGTALVAISLVGILLCQSADRFMALRLAHGFGTGVAIVNIGAIVGDLFTTQEAARALSVISLIQAGVRLAAPVAGAALLTTFGWRSIFQVLLVYSALLGLILWLKLPETVPSAGRGHPEIFRRAIRGYIRIFGRPGALGYAACLSLTTGCMFAFLADAAFIYMEWFGLDTGAFSGLLALNVAAMAVCSILNVRLLKRHAADRITRVACGAQCLAACALLAHVTLMTPSLPVVVALLTASMGVPGLIIGNAGACFLGHFPDLRATASGATGSILFLVGGALGTGLGILHTGTLATIAVVLTLCACIAAAAMTFATPPPEVATP